MPTTRWTARSLAIETFSRLSEQPILALPVVVAELLSFAAMHLQHALHEPLFKLLFSQKDSILGTTSTPFQLTPEDAWKASLIVLPLLWVCYFLIACFYVAALIATSTLVDSRASDPKQNWSEVRAAIMRKGSPLLIYSGVLLGLFIVMEGLSLGALTVIMQIPFLAPAMGRGLGMMVAMLLEILVVVICAPRALKLAQDLPSAYDPNAVRLATWSGIALVVAETVLLMLETYAIPASFFRQTTISGLLFREVVQGLIAALPYIPFFVALALFARQNVTTELDESREDDGDQ